MLQGGCTPCIVYHRRAMGLLDILVSPRKPPPIRHFLYISDAKVDHLLAQIGPISLRKWALELSIKTSSLKVKVKPTEHAEPTRERIERLLIVERHILEEEPVGVIGDTDSPAEYIAGSQACAWIAEDGAVAFISKRTEGRPPVVLVGSSHHLIGVPLPPEPAVYTQRPFRALEILFPNLLSGGANVEARNPSNVAGLNLDKSVSFELSGFVDLAHQSVVPWGPHRIGMPAGRNLQFLGKNLGFFDGVQLLSPLYVCML